MKHFESLDDYKSFLRQFGETLMSFKISNIHYELGILDSEGKRIDYYLLDDNNHRYPYIGFSVETANRYTHDGFQDATIRPFGNISQLSSHHIDFNKP